MNYVKLFGFILALRGMWGLASDSRQEHLADVVGIVMGFILMVVAGFPWRYR